MHAPRFAPVALLVATLSGCGAEAPSSLDGPRATSLAALAAAARAEGAVVTEVYGEWKSGTLEIVRFDPATGDAAAVGTDVFTGTFTGTSTFYVEGRFLPNGSFRGFSNETITAVAADGTSGTITEAHQPLEIDAAGTFDETSPITGGTGDWAGSRGLLFYDGFVDPFGGSPDQGGTYQGIWIRPAAR